MRNSSSIAPFTIGLCCLIVLVNLHESAYQIKAYSPGELFHALNDYFVGQKGFETAAATATAWVQNKTSDLPPSLSKNESSDSGARSADHANVNWTSSLEEYENSSFKEDTPHSDEDSLARYSHIIKPFDSKGAVAIARRKKQLASAALLDHTFYTENELEFLIRNITTTFRVWAHSSQPYDWCHTRMGKNDGLLYVKLPKCASSTAAGVAMRVADKLGHRLWRRKCVGQYLHSPASHQRREYGQRNTSTSFLWSIIREPNERTISYFFFEQVSRQKMEASTETLLSFLVDNSAMKKNYMVRYLKLQAINSNMQELIREIMTEYNFIGVSDRMDESLVVLAMIMQVPVADMVLLSSKISGGYDAGGTKDGCVKLVKKKHLPVVDEYMRSIDWKKDNWDYILYEVVNRTLDNTINFLGRDKVEREVKNMRQLAEKVQTECLSEAVFPCPETLPNHREAAILSCYYGDSGCGYKCIDRVLGQISDAQWNDIQRRVGINRAEDAASLSTLHQINAGIQDQSPTDIPAFLLRYIQVHRDSINGGKVKDGVPFLVYRCFGGCAGIGGRIKAIIKSFYTAVCSDRVFLIDSPFPFPLQDFLSPNLMEWNASYPNGTLEWDIFTSDEGERNIVMPNITGVAIRKAHGRSVLDLRQIWRTPTCQAFWNKRESEIVFDDEHQQYHWGSRVLFQFTDEVNRRAVELLQASGIPSNDPYIGVHIRTGSGSTWNDRAHRFLPHNRNQPSVFANCFRLLQDTYGFDQGYIASDNDSAKEDLHQIEPLLKIAKVEAFHIDRSISRNVSNTILHFEGTGNNVDGSASFEQAKNGTLDLFAELKILVDAKCRVMTWSSFSYAAHTMSSSPHCGFLVTDCSNATVSEPNRKYNLIIGKWDLYRSEIMVLP